jgi:REP element-mobilizing transposase RayT
LVEFLWGKSFWSVGYFAETVGKLEESVIRRYIREQRCAGTDSGQKASAI